MRNPINTKKTIWRRRCTQTKSRERATTVTNIGTRVDIIPKGKENKYFTY